MNLDDLRAHIKVSSVQDLQDRIMEIRARRRNINTHVERARAKSFDAKLDKLSAAEIEKLLESLDAGGDDAEV